jgi:hypothetical protein
MRVSTSSLCKGMAAPGVLRLRLPRTAPAARWHPVGAGGAGPLSDKRCASGLAIDHQSSGKCAEQDGVGPLTVASLISRHDSDAGQAGDSCANERPSALASVPSASSLTVRSLERCWSTDGADGLMPVLRDGSWWAVMTRMVRVPNCPSRRKVISTPRVRKNVCARRSRPASARGLLGQPGLETSPPA